MKSVVNCEAGYHLSSIFAYTFSRVIRCWLQWDHLVSLSDRNTLTLWTLPWLYNMPSKSIVVIKAHGDQWALCGGPIAEAGRG